MGEGKYMPSVEEIQKAEGMMSDKEKITSSRREQILEKRPAHMLILEELNVLVDACPEFNNEHVIQSFRVPIIELCKILQRMTLPPEELPNIIERLEKILGSSLGINDNTEARGILIPNILGRLLESLRQDASNV